MAEEPRDVRELVGKLLCFDDMVPAGADLDSAVGPKTLYD